MSRGRRIARIKFVPPSQSAAEKYLFEWDNRQLFHKPESFPKLTPQNLFQQDQPMVLEVGCGTGEFLINYAQARPDLNFVGVEISRRVIYHAVNQSEKASLDNIKFIKADIHLLYQLMAPQTWSEIHLNFPDPNYGAGRKKHRVFNTEFLDACRLSLTPSGKISVVTDQHTFLMDMLEIAEADPRFEKEHSSRYLEGFNPDQKTRFQSTWERFERAVYRFELILSPSKQ